MAQSSTHPGDRAFDPASARGEDAVSLGGTVGEPTTLADLGSGGETSARKQASLWGDAWRRLIRNKLAVIGLVIVITFILLAIFAPLLAPYSEREVISPEYIGETKGLSPSWTFPFGVDLNGRDVFS